MAVYIANNAYFVTAKEIKINRVLYFRLTYNCDIFLLASTGSISSGKMGSKFSIKAASSNDVSDERVLF